MCAVRYGNRALMVWRFAVSWSGMDVLEGGKNVTGTERSRCWKVLMSFGSVELLQKRIPSCTHLGVTEVVEG